MKLILSRKGFDSQYGGIASPILPDGRLVPLPIPSAHDHHSFADLGIEHPDLDRLLSDLSGGRHRLSSHVHLDPDLTRPDKNRPAGWRPAFGQTGSAQGHLAMQGIGVGDVFLFFGWFRQVECASGRWSYVRGAPDLHVLFGWLEVAEVMQVVTDRESCLRRHPWIADHPHVANSSHYTDLRNTLYVAAEHSRYRPNAPFGAGRFGHFDAALQLTAPGRSRSRWRLPSWFQPGSAPPLSYHASRSRWETDGEHVLLQSVAKGQEFVLDANHYPQAEAWITSIVGEHA